MAPPRAPRKDEEKRNGSPRCPLTDATKGYAPAHGIATFSTILRCFSWQKVEERKCHASLNNFYNLFSMYHLITGDLSTQTSVRFISCMGWVFFVSAFVFFSTWRPLLCFALCRTEQSFPRLVALHSSLSLLLLCVCQHAPQIILKTGWYCKALRA